ncbi:uncharacterized protein proser2 [Polymixia lowei]
MSKGQLTSDQVAMDVHLRSNPQLHFGVNGGAGRNSRPSEDETLQFLSQEEQECILFFEETIDSLEESLEEEEERKQRALSSPATTAEEVDGFPDLPLPPFPSPNPRSMSPLPERPPSPKDKDIIDLVRPPPDLVHTKESPFNTVMPDFQSMVVGPESHFEMKPRRDPVDTLPLEYNSPLPSIGYGSSDGHSLYHPPGCIPTPVLIAQKIAENQGNGTSNLHSSSLLRCKSLESDKPPSYTSDHSVKQGPPTSTKPTRFPGNINVMLGSKEHHNQSLANVSIQERRAQMLANLTGTSLSLEQEEPQYTSTQKARNIPTRSVSFRDPTPDKSRLEALSKLGLTRNRAMSGGTSGLTTPNNTTPPSTKNTETSTKPPILNVSSQTHSQTLADRKPETVTDCPGDKATQANPSPPATVTRSSYHPPPVESKPVSPPPEVASLDFNSYGGKTIVVNPSASSKSEPLVSADSNASQSALASPSDFNSYGGKTKVMAPASVSVSGSDLPDILSSHIDKNRYIPPPTKPETLPYDLNSYGGKTRNITPSTSSNPSSNSPARTPKPSAPSLAPKPPRHHGFLSPHKAAARHASPEPRRKSMSKPASFRSQGITVQFSGRGATDESRREALRKLGLLKDTC